jgi:hypothetical protein
VITILEIENPDDATPHELEILVRNVHTIGKGRNLVLFRGEGRKPHDYTYDLKRRLAKHYLISVEQIEDWLGLSFTVTAGTVRVCRTKNWNRPIPGQASLLDVLNVPT